MTEALIIIVFLVVAAGAVYWYVKYKMPQEKAEKMAEQRFLQEVARAENKVKVSDPISRRDIEVLESANSLFVNDAIALRRQQVEQGRSLD